MTDLTKWTCEGTDDGASCRDVPPLGLQVRFALAYAPMVVWLALRVAAVLAWYVLRRLARLRWPALTTTLLPSRTGAPGGGPMCWADEGGHLTGATYAAGACVPIPRRLRAPVLVLVLRRLDEGWTLRPTAEMRAV